MDRVSAFEDSRVIVFLDDHRRIQVGHLVHHRHGLSETIQVKVAGKEGVDHEEIVSRKDVLFRHDHLVKPRAQPNLEPFYWRFLLRAHWGQLAFGRVSRVVTTAADLNIWYRPPPGSDQAPRYLGDNKAILKQFTRDQLDKYVKCEYNYFYGFCGPISDAHDDGRDEEPCPYENTPQHWLAKAKEKHEAQQQVPFGFFGRHREKQVQRDWEVVTDDLPRQLKHVKSCHFASPAFGSPSFLQRSFGLDRDDEGPVVDLFKKTTYVVEPPACGDLVCGIPVESERGITLVDWFVAPEAFLHLWKLMWSNRIYPHDWPVHENMRQLRWKGEPLFQDLAKVAVFGRHGSSKAQSFLEALHDIHRKNVLGFQ